MSAPAPSAFSFEPLFLVLVAAAAWLYWRDVAQTSAEERPSRRRQALFALGLALIALPLNSPLETLAAHYLLIFHLLQNAMIADWGPPLLLLGLSPGMRRRICARGGRPLAALTRPLVALALWLAAWYGIHLPGFYDWALRSGWALNLEHAILIAAGLVFWWPLFELPRRMESLTIAGYLGVAFVTSPWLSLAYIFSSSPFYGFYSEAPRLFGLSPLKDQNLAGILMNAEQTSIFFVAFAWYLLRVLAEEEEAQRARDAVLLARWANEQDARAPSGAGRKVGEQG